MSKEETINIRVIQSKGMLELETKEFKRLSDWAVESLIVALVEEKLERKTSISHILQDIIHAIFRR